MRHLLFIFLASVSLVACKKDNNKNSDPLTGDLAGKWRMVSLTDNATNSTITKPPAITGNIDISFTFSSSSTGIMQGITPANTLSGDYSTGNNRALTIPAVSTTKVNEPEWGNLFLDNITHASNYMIGSDGKLNITVSTNKTLSFARQ